MSLEVPASQEVPAGQEVPASQEVPAIQDDEEEEDDPDMPPLEIIGPPRQPASLLPAEEDFMFLPHVEAPAEVLPMEDVVFMRRMDALLAQANPALLQEKNEYVRILQEQQAKEAQEKKDAEDALRAKKTTAGLLQRLVREPAGIDDFIASVNRAQLALENMKNFAKDLKVQKILQEAQEAQEAKDAEERRLQAEEEALTKPAAELSVSDLEVLKMRAERLVKEECKVKSAIYRDAGRVQGPLERKVKETLKQERMPQESLKVQKTLQEKKDQWIKDLQDAPKNLRQGALNIMPDLTLQEKEALQKHFYHASELTESDKEVLQKMHTRLYHADKEVLQKNTQMIKYLQDDRDALDARDKELMEKPVAELSASDYNFLVRRAESMIKRKERDIMDPEEPLAQMTCLEKPKPAAPGGRGGPEEPAEPAEDDAKHMHEGRVKEALTDLGLAYFVTGEPAPARAPNMSESDLQALAEVVAKRDAMRSGSSSSQEPA